MKTYARVSEGLVHELFVTDGDMAEMFHPDMIWVEITDLVPEPVVGWSAYEESGSWIFSEPVPPAPTDTELKMAAIGQRDALLSIADEATAGMADAYIADLLDAADIAKFKAYAAYKLKLNKIDHQPGFPQTIEWPLLPT